MNEDWWHIKLFTRASLENQFIYPIPKGSKLIFFAPPGVGVNEENQLRQLCEAIKPGIKNHSEDAEINIAFTFF